MAKASEELDKLRVVELREKASKAGITGSSHMKKDDLIDALADEGKTAPAAAAGPVDVIALLIEDHEKVKALFAEALAKEEGDESMAALAEQICAELALHTAAEEEIFYPALKSIALDDDNDDAKDLVLEAYVEHGSVKELIANLQALTPADESYKAILQVMSEQVDHHVEEEESEMFKQARALLGDKLDEIGQQVVAFKESASHA